MDLAQVVFEKKARRYTVNLFGQTFVGFIQPKMKVRDILDSLYAAWGIHTVPRSSFCLLATGINATIPEEKNIDKLLAPKQPKYVVGCTVTSLINAPDLGKGTSLHQVFSLSEMMGGILQKIISPLGIDTSSFSIQVEGTTVNLNDFIRPLAAISLGEFLASAPNTLNFTSSQPIPVLAHKLEEAALQSRMMASDTVDKGRKVKASRPPTAAIEVSPRQKSEPKMRALEKGGEMKKTTSKDEEFTMQEQQPSSPPVEMDFSKPINMSAPPAEPAGPSAINAGPQSLAAAAFARLPTPPEGKEEAAATMVDGKSFEGEDGEKLDGAAPPIPPTKYTMNMGMEYYSVMMEKTSYLFYIHLSQKELKIETEEGKTVYQTTFTFVTKKEEPPVLDLRVYGEGFEVHPFSGRVTVMKDAINPPLIIFSVMPVPIKPKAKEGTAGTKPKNQKGPDERHLHVMVTYEGDVVSHTVLGVTIQPKHYRIKIGPFRINVGKPAATLISVITSIAASYSVIQGILGASASPTIEQAVGSIAPGLVSWIAIILYFVALIKAIKPLKETWAAAFAAGKAPGMMK